MKENKILHNVIYYDYDQKLFPFKEMVTDLFGINDLENIHSLMDKINDKLFTNETDDQTILHKKFYKKLTNDWKEFEEVYVNFIRKLMTDIYNLDSIIYQAKPTFRVQLPNNIAVGGNIKDTDEYYGFHRDTDKEYNHPPFEKNFIIPLTDSRDTQSVYIETNPGNVTFEPVIMEVGQFFNFNGGTCLHGNKPNETNLSRVSLDFRIVFPSDYDESYSKNSKLSGQKFVIGEYYNEL